MIFLIFAAIACNQNKTFKLTKDQDHWHKIGLTWKNIGLVSFPHFFSQWSIVTNHLKGRLAFQNANRKNMQQIKYRNIYFQHGKKDSSDKITAVVFWFILLSTFTLTVVAGDLGGKRIQINIFLLFYFHLLSLKFKGSSSTYWFSWKWTSFFQANSSNFWEIFGRQFPLTRFAAIFLLPSWCNYFGGVDDKGLILQLSVLLLHPHG